MGSGALPPFDNGCGSESACTIKQHTTDSVLLLHWMARPLNPIEFDVTVLKMISSSFVVE